MTGRINMSSILRFFTAYYGTNMASRFAQDTFLSGLQSTLNGDDQKKEHLSGSQAKTEK